MIVIGRDFASGELCVKAVVVQGNILKFVDGSARMPLLRELCCGWARPVVKNNDGLPRQRARRAANGAHAADDSAKPNLAIMNRPLY